MESQIQNHEGKSRKPQIIIADQNSKPLRWKTRVEQQIYSSKLLEALSLVQRNVPARDTQRRSRAVREAADRVLAFTARGRTRWSHAILANRIKLKKLRRNRRLTSSIGTKKSAFPSYLLQEKKLPAMDRKVKLLGRLVPGCRKLSFPMLLEETKDYISALEMQIRAMSALTDLLSSSGETAPISEPLRADSSR